MIATAEQPTHLITRDSYYVRTGGPFGFTPYQKKPTERVAKDAPLVVVQTIGVTELARRALGRPREDQYDPVIVTTADRHRHRDRSRPHLGAF